MSAAVTDSQQRLEQEIATLRRRLESAEEMHRAIVHQEVDAFVVGRDEKERQILLLGTAAEQDRAEEAAGTVEALRRGEIDGVVVGGERIELLGEVNRELHEIVRRKDEFIAVLGHELRNPLASIVNGLEILRRSANLEPQARYAIQVMGRQTATLIRLVDDLLDINRLNQGKVSLERRRIDLKRVIADAAESVGPDLEIKRHTLQLDLHPGPVWVQGDPIRLAQVVLNLLTNASKYTDAGGTIRVVLQRRPDGSGSSRAVIQVIDSGIGIAPGHLAEIFEPFTQLPHAGGRASAGLGLGLSICRRLIELHGGGISARSAGDNQGSEFSIELPEALGETQEG